MQSSDTRVEAADNRKRDDCSLVCTLSGHRCVAANSRFQLPSIDALGLREKDATTEKLELLFEVPHRRVTACHALSSLARAPCGSSRGSPRAARSARARPAVSDAETSPPQGQGRIHMNRRFMPTRRCVLHRKRSRALCQYTRDRRACRARWRLDSHTLELGIKGRVVNLGVRARVARTCPRPIVESTDPAAIEEKDLQRIAATTEGLKQRPLGAT
jgi:hypothetical protein